MNTPARIACIVVLAITYFIAGRLGLSLAFLNASASAVWPPTGIALASVLVMGRWLWPGIALGAFAVNLTTPTPLLVAASIALGNTAEAVLGAMLVNRFANGVRAFERGPDVVRFGVLGGILAPAVAATWGVSTLLAAGLTTRTHFAGVWLTWWLGDASGAIVIAPALVLSLTGRESSIRGRAIERALLGAAVFVVGMCIFGGWVPLSARPYPLGFLFLPLLLWPAFRFGPRETALSALLLAGIVVWGTLHGTGPFSPYPPHEALLLLQTYSGVVALTSCTIAALVAEARRARDDLEGRVHERTDELRLSNRNLRAEIDERERMHAALRASEARLLEAQTIAHLGSWEWEVESDSLWWSDELYRIYGLDRRTFQASYDGFLERVHPEDRERVAAAVAGALAGEDLLTFEHRIVRPDGTVRTLAARGRVIRDADGKAARMLGTGQDITERKRAEHGQAQLREAQAAQRQAEEASKLKDEFLAIVSHELRTPLNAIMGWTRMLATGALGQEAAAKAVEVIERNARAQAGLIDDLLDVSRFMSGQFRLEARPLDVGPVLEAALEAIEPTAAARKLRIESRNDAPAARVLGDPRRMQQIVSNLLSNAVKFSPPGGTVAMEVTTRDSHVVLRVTDTGPGIDPAHVERIFEPFWQADTTYTRTHGGLGLGLAIVRFLVEAHGGAVKVEPREPGASFVVTLPRHLD